MGLVDGDGGSLWACLLDTRFLEVVAGPAPLLFPFFTLS